MKHRFLTTIALLAAFGVSGAELLENREWKFAKTWNAAGNLTKLDDGTYQLENTGNTGSVTIHCGDSEYTITPGKHYLVTVDMEHSNPMIQNSLMVALPGARRVRKPELRTPRSTGSRTAIEFTARPDERRLALYLTLDGTGKSIIKSIKIEEYTPGKNLIQRPGINWKFIAAKETQGKMSRLDDNSLRVEKTGGKAHVMSYLALPYPIKPGRSYRITLTGKVTDSVNRWGLMAQSGSQKSWPSINGKGKPGEWETISMNIKTAEGDKGLTIYAVIHNTGSLTVKDITVEELSNRKEVLGATYWSANPANIGKTVKNSDGSWNVEKTNEKGLLAFAHHKFHKVVPGKHYLVEWEIKLAPGQKVNSMIYLPRNPKARAPWPSGKVVTGDNSWQKVTQIITAEEGEESMRLHLVIEGKTGLAVVRSCAITELDDEEFQAITQTK